MQLSWPLVQLANAVYNELPELVPVDPSSVNFVNESECNSFTILKLDCNIYVHGTPDMFMKFLILFSAGVQFTLMRHLVPTPLIVVSVVNDKLNISWTPTWQIETFAPRGTLTLCTSQVYLQDNCNCRRMKIITLRSQLTKSQ